MKLGGGITIMQGDNRERLKEFPDNHFDSCVCDPPYELGFMGKAWDKSGIAYDVAMWKEVFRVMKPGAHLLAFGGSRTYHRLACAIEDAGFQIRDQIMWIYGSGFPKSLDVSKGMDKAAGVKRQVVGEKPRVGGGRATHNQHEGYQRPWMDDPGAKNKIWEISAPATGAAHEWDGWGTALKPAHEPIVVARKPLEGTVVSNVLKHGTGAINVAGCRIEGPEPHHNYGRTSGENSFVGEGPVSVTPQGGRWPANVIHDGSPEVLAAFPDTKGQQGDVRGTEASRTGGKGTVCYGEYGRVPAGKRGDNGSAARFFYCAKASPKERNLGLEALPDKEIPYSEYRENFDTTKSIVSEYADGSPRPMNKQKNSHPTVKPLTLMAYLVRLVTPPGGMVLDPFMGSGSTLIAAAKEGFDAVGIELEAGNCEIAERRCHGHLGMLAEVVNA